MQARIFVLCDDDEIFVDNLETIITTAYLENPDAVIIIFKMFNQGAKFGNQRRKLRKYELMDLQRRNQNRNHH